MQNNHLRIEVPTQAAESRDRSHGWRRERSGENMPVPAWSGTFYFGQEWIRVDFHTNDNYK